MDDALLAAYQATDYRVRLARGGYAAIRIGQALSPPLRTLAGDHAWGFITAWNPRSEPTPRPQNRGAQRALLAVLRAFPQTLLIRPGRGVSRDGRWIEPSLWVVGPDTAPLDALALRFGQFGYVHGRGATPAQLRLPPGA
ncbi:DUF3293 domain-containing protein [Dyella telluris]|uniref:DUF3293 domain-containing protein n=1 Tax=Dyella telluris TaxID=2763498 RepID=A0A7G8Q202_9GAMM|nr:DUF3293 domain-containing protein [Dyella telluris]QNK00810.1 DUF3293 domain-containing protein [Dyella telluris]